MRKRELTTAWWESHPILTGGASLPAFFPSALASLVDMYKLEEQRREAWWTGRRVGMRCITAAMRLLSTYLDRETPFGRIAKPLAIEIVAKKAVMKTLMVLLATNAKRERHRSLDFGFNMTFRVAVERAPELVKYKELDSPRFQEHAGASKHGTE